MKPKPFSFNKNQVKAFVLGADPTNNTNKGKIPKELIFAFGIGQDARYFMDILANINRLGLHLEDLYIQNLLPESQEEETTKNKNFVEKARQNVRSIESEFNKIDKTRKVPVLLTAEKVYIAVLKESKIIENYGTYYRQETDIPIPASDNLLGRPVIPFFRHEDYDLVHWPEYESFLKEIFT